MSPEGIAALSAVVVAAVGAGPAYLGLLRQIRGAARDAGDATREAVAGAIDVAVARLDGRLDELRHGVQDMREWQASHTAEHLLIQHNRQIED